MTLDGLEDGDDVDYRRMTALVYGLLAVAVAAIVVWARTRGLG